MVKVGFRDQALRKARTCTVEAPSILYNIPGNISEDEYQAIFFDFRTLLFSFKPTLSAICEAIARFAELCPRVEIRSFNTPSPL